jgi:CRISPR/Cas system-associated exonuclease Cas4 (RecB family)
MEPPARVNGSSLAVEIKKEGAVQQKLESFLVGKGNKSLSPSAINEYLDCSLRFALKRIYGFREPDEIAHASEPKGFGILIHQVMNRLYREFIGTKRGPGSEWLKNLVSDQSGLAEIILDEYRMVLSESERVKPGGKDLLGIEVVRQFITKIIEFDINNPVISILGLEKDFRMEYPVEINGKLTKVNLNGIIDRIDQVDGGIRIIDYKTGNCELNSKSIADLFIRGSMRRPKEVFQVLLYCEFLLNHELPSSDLMPGLFRLGKFRGGEYDFRAKVAGKDVVFAEVREEFNTGFKEVLKELFNPDVPFKRTEDEQICRYCPFTGICSRDA